MIAFLYGRVSTEDQSESMQTREMLEMCERRGWQSQLFSDHGMSGARADRPELQRMLSLCRKRKCDVVVVYRFDRFARSVKQLVGALEEFETLGIQFVSVHEQVDTTSPHGRLMFHLFGAFAEFEREIIRQRVKSGMANAKARGVRLGRARKVVDVRQIVECRSSGRTWDEVAHEVGVSVATCQRVARKAAGA